MIFRYLSKYHHWRLNLNWHILKLIELVGVFFRSWAYCARDFQCILRFVTRNILFDFEIGLTFENRSNRHLYAPAADNGSIQGMPLFGFLVSFIIGSSNNNICNTLQSVKMKWNLLKLWWYVFQCPTDICLPLITKF